MHEKRTPIKADMRGIEALCRARVRWAEDTADAEALDAWQNGLDIMFTDAEEHSLVHSFISTLADCTELTAEQIAAKCREIIEDVKGI